MKEDEADCIDALVDFLYSLNYCDGAFESENRLAKHVKMCILADKYDMEPLRALAVQKFKGHAELKYFCTEPQLAEATMIAYEAPGPTEEIRKEIVRVALKEGFLFSDTSKAAGPMVDLLETCTRLAGDVVKAILCKSVVLSKGSTWWCVGCGTNFAMISGPRSAQDRAEDPDQCCYCGCYDVQPDENYNKA